MNDSRLNVGELLMVGIPGSRLDRRTRAALGDLGTRAVILFRRNAETPAQLRRLCASLHRLKPDFVVGIDHEGGRVNRLPQPFTAFPPAAAIGRSASPRLAFAVGRAIGRELASVGIDIDFAPVLDVLTNRRNRVIGDRAFGSDAATVARLGLAFARGLRAAGIFACGKHFPGHGATRGDSHVVLPRVTSTRADLSRVHLAPFRQAVAAGIPSLMIAHVIYRSLDSTTCASLSPRIIDGLLRRRLGYRGIVVTDDLEMGAVARRRPPEEIAVHSVAAGADLLLVCSNLDVARRARSGLAHALATGALPRARVEEAVRRLRRLRPRQPTGLSIRRWPVPQHLALARTIA